MRGGWAMKAVILAGGLGTRLSEETSVLPKPLVEIGAEPILWHIMKIFSRHGVKDFIICCGYKGHLIKKYFQDFRVRGSSVTFDLGTSEVSYIDPPGEDWRVTLVDTGLETMTGGRLQRIRHLLGNDTFFMTYGDGVGDIDLTALLQFHQDHGKSATVTAVQPTGRFGAMYLKEDDSLVHAFNEKPNGDGTWISGGFFVLNPSIFGLLDGDETIWERGPMVQLTRQSELVAYRHYGFWHPMDTLRDKMVLNEMWASQTAHWKVW
jgi:glucose-1-phosphate cytidylyltransferase